MRETNRGRWLVLVVPLVVLLLGWGAVGNTASSPELTLVSGPSLFPPGCDLSGSTNTNYENAEVEPSLAIDPTDSNHMVGIWQQDRWRQNGGAHGLMTGVTRDGGKTWSRNFAIFSNCSGGNAENGANYQRTSDPWITISPDGTVYESGLAFDIFPDTNQAIHVNRSTDGGDTWSNPTALQFDTDPTIEQDKDSITADPLDSRFVYAAWTRIQFTDATLSVVAAAPAYFSRSTDGGKTWEPARAIYTPPMGFQTNDNQIYVLPDGTVLHWFLLSNENFNLAWYIRRSSDKGVTWSQPIFLEANHDIGVTDVKTGQLVRAFGTGLAVDPKTGAVYFAWEDARFSDGLRDGIAFSKSTDGGLTWTPAVQVNKAPNVQAFCPEIAVTKSGRISITYYDFRKDTPDPTTLLTNYWEIISDDGGETWSEVPLSPSFDTLTAPFSGTAFMIGDYEGLVPLTNSFFSLFVATNSGNTSNRTDIFAISSKEAGDTTTNGHIEVNPHPLTGKELMEMRRERRPSAWPK